MARLNLNSICDIVYRLRRGQSERGIAKDLGILVTRSGIITILLGVRAIWTCIGLFRSLTSCRASLVPRRRPRWWSRPWSHIGRWWKTS